MATGLFQTQFSTKQTSDSSSEIINAKFEYCQDFNGDGYDDIRVTFTLDPSTTTSSEDLIGVAFSIQNNAISGLQIGSITAQTSTYTPTWGFAADAVSDDPGKTDPGFNTSGGTIQEPFDGYVKFSDQGEADGSVQQASFILFSTSTSLDAVQLLSNTDWYFRLQSTDGGKDSAKIGGEILALPPCDDDGKTGSIKGCKYEDGDGDLKSDKDRQTVSNWTIVLCDAKGVEVARTVTDKDGCYEFKDLAPGEYVVKEIVQDNWYALADLEGIPVKIGESGLDVEGVNFVNTEYAKISGHKFEDRNCNGSWDKGENGLEGWTIQLCDKDGKAVLDSKGNAITAITDKAGYYEFKNLKPGDYTTKEILKDGWVQTKYSEGASLKSGEHDKSGNDFGNVLKPGIEVDKTVVGVVGGKYKNGEWVVDSVGDTIKYSITVKNTGGVDLTNVSIKDCLEDKYLDSSKFKLTGDKDKDGVLDVGETWTYSYSYKVTKADLAEAQKIVTYTEKVGFFNCTYKKCTGDLDIDNCVVVTADAGKCGTVSGYDYEAVDVACPKGCTYDYNPDYGTSGAEMLYQQLQSAAA